MQTMPSSCVAWADLTRNRLNDLGLAPIAGAVFKHEDEVARVQYECLWRQVLILVLGN